MSRGFSESRMWRVYRTVRSPRATSESCATWVYTSWPKRASSCTASIESTPDSIRSATRSLNSPKSGSRSRGSWREICTPTLPFRIDHENRRIRGRNTGDASRLCDRARADLPELLASLSRELGQRFVPERIRQIQVLISRRPLDLAKLPSNVSLVAHLDAGRLYGLAREIRKLRAVDDVFDREGPVAEKLGERLGPRCRDRSSLDAIGRTPALGARVRNCFPQDPSATHARDRGLPVQSPLLARPDLVRTQCPELAGMRKKPIDHVILPQQQAILGAGREHPVGLLGSLSYYIVN